MWGVFATYAAQVRAEFVFLENHLVAVVLQRERRVGCLGEDESCIVGIALWGWLERRRRRVGEGGAHMHRRIGIQKCSIPDLLLGFPIHEVALRRSVSGRRGRRGRHSGERAYLLHWPAKGHLSKVAA